MTTNWDLDPGTAPPTYGTQSPPAPPTSGSQTHWTPPNPPPPLPTATPPPSRRGSGRRVVLALIAVVALVAAGVFAGRAVFGSDDSSSGDVATAGTQTDPPVKGDPDEPIAAVAEALGPAVVQIETDEGPLRVYLPDAR